MVSPRSLINLPHILTYCNTLKEVTGVVCSGDAAAALLPRNLQGEEVVRVTRNAKIARLGIHISLQGFFFEDFTRGTKSTHMNNFPLIPAKPGMEGAEHLIQGDP
jgi:hypothetical protein